jgi:hypothetical protein
MRATTIALTILGFLSTRLPAPLRAQPPTGGPCAQITAVPSHDRPVLAGAFVLTLTNESA